MSASTARNKTAARKRAESERTTASKLAKGACAKIAEAASANPVDTQACTGVTTRRAESRGWLRSRP